MLKIWNIQTNSCIQESNLPQWLFFKTLTDDCRGWSCKWVPRQSVCQIDVAKEKWGLNNFDMSKYEQTIFDALIEEGENDDEGAEDSEGSTEEGALIGEEKEGKKTEEKSDLDQPETQSPGKAETHDGSPKKVKTEDLDIPKDFVMVSTANHIGLFDPLKNDYAASFQNLLSSRDIFPQLTGQSVLVHMERINIVHYLPELSLYLAVSQGCCSVALVQIV